MRIAALGSIGMLLFACGGPVWTDDSESIEVRRHSFWDGTYLFRRNAEDLSPGQLRLVRAIRTIDTDVDGCALDLPEIDLVVKDKAGARHEYNAMPRPCMRPEPLVDYEQVDALLRTVSCLPGSALVGESPATAPHIAIGDGCSHGLFHAMSGSVTWLLVDIEDSGPHRFAVEGHVCTAQVELFDENGETRLARAEAGADECSLLDHEFEATGTYALRIVPNGAFYLSANRLP